MHLWSTILIFLLILLSKMVPLHMSWVKFTNLEVISIFCSGVLNNLKNTIQKYFKVPNRAVYFLWSLVICFIYSEPLFKHTYSTFPTTRKRSRTPIYIYWKSIIGRFKRDGSKGIWFSLLVNCTSINFSVFTDVISEFSNLL